MLWRIFFNILQKLKPDIIKFYSAFFFYLAPRAALKRLHVFQMPARETIFAFSVRTLSLAKQIMIIYAGTKGYLDELPVDSVRRFEEEFGKFIERKYPNIEYEINEKQELSESLQQKLDKAIEEFKSEFVFKPQK